MKKKFTIFPAVLSKTKSDFSRKIARARASGMKGVQIDVMDGIFVPARTYRDVSEILKMKPKDLFFEVQLMVSDPLIHIMRWAHIADRFLVHLESCSDVRPLVHLVRDLGKEIGLAVNPKTSVRKLFPYLPRIDVALVMTVEPGKSGQKLIPRTLDKVKALRKRTKRLPIEVDGGINEKTAGSAVEAGASILVVGSYLWKEKNITKAIHNLTAYASTKKKPSR